MGKQNRAGHDDDDDGNGGWAYLRDEEVYQEWIKLSDEQIGYRGDRAIVLILSVPCNERLHTLQILQTFIWIDGHR